MFKIKYEFNSKINNLINNILDLTYFQLKKNNI